MFGLCYNLLLPNRISEYNGMMSYRIQPREIGVLAPCSEEESLDPNNVCNTSRGWREYKQIYSMNNIILLNGAIKKINSNQKVFSTKKLNPLN